jgi:phytanoyl-CoA hydroxylase
MDKGDIVFFHPYLIHGSGENRSNGFRKSICCHFASSECNYIDTKGTFHETLAKDIMSYAARKFGKNDMKYEDVWRFKARLIQGESVQNGL